jgi:hypothetical protein
MPLQGKLWALDERRVPRGRNEDPGGRPDHRGHPRDLPKAIRRSSFIEDLRTA